MATWFRSPSLSSPTDVKIQDGSHVTLKSCSRAASLICSKESNYPQHMLITFGVILPSHFYVVYIKKLVTVLYFSIINVFWLLNLCGVGEDASFAPQANLV